MQPTAPAERRRTQAQTVRNVEKALWKVCSLGAALSYGYLSRKIEHRQSRAAAGETKTVYLTRHAQASHNLVNDFSIPDPHLTELGEWQARELLPKNLRALLRVARTEEAEVKKTASDVEEAIRQNGVERLVNDSATTLADPAAQDLIESEKRVKALAGEGKNKGSETTDRHSVVDYKELAIEHKAHDIKRDLVNLGVEAVAELPGDEGPLELIVASPMKRTLQTCLLGYKHYINRGTPVVVLPEIQEVGDYPCDTGSAITELRSEFPGFSYEELERLENSGHRPWYTKKGKFHPDPFTVMKRADRFVKWLIERPEKHIAVVTHGGLLQWILRRIKGFSNAEVRKYTLAPNMVWRRELAFKKEEVIDDTIAHEMEEVTRR